jgi:16S rRNA (cytosine1407-C5)-methyltransferase
MISELLKYDTDAINQYFSCYQHALQKSIKIVERKIKIADFLWFSHKYGRSLEKQSFTKNSDVYYITRDVYDMWLWKHWLHNSWFFYIQEVAASIPIQFLPITPGDIVLDMCSAPWGKAVQIADRWWFVVSNEVNKSRIVPLQYNLNRIWVYNSTVTSIQWEKRWQLLPNFFDHILVDAPCSWEWTGFKSDDGIKWWREESIHKIATLQKQLLSSAINACKVWWTIVYSTCTINPWENEWVVAYALEIFGNSIWLDHIEISWKSTGITSWNNTTLLSDEDSKKVGRFLPHKQHTWWFFIAKFTKKAVCINQQGDNKETNTLISQLDVSVKLQNKIADILLRDYWIHIDPSVYFFISSQKQIYLTTPQYKDIHWKIFTEKTWVPIFKIDKDNLIPLHWLWNCLWHIATKNILSLPEHVLQKYSEWQDIQLSSEWWTITIDNKYAILTYENYGISVGKVVDGYIKNKFIK